MAIAFDADLGGTFANTSATTLALTTAAAAAANAKVVVSVGGNAAPTGVTDSAGTTYRQVSTGIVSGAANVYIFEGDLGAGGLASSSTITATYGSSIGGRMVMASSFTGVGTGSASVESSQTRTQVNATTWISNGITPAANNEMVFAAAASAGAADATNTAAGGFTGIRSAGAGGSARNWCSEYVIQTTAATVQATGTWSVSQAGTDGVNMAVIFSLPTGAPWDKVVAQVFAPERQQVMLGPRWMMGAGDAPADWSTTPPQVGGGFDVPSLIPTVFS